MRGCYPILDLDACLRLGLDPMDVAAAMLAARPALLQFRAKAATARETLRLLSACQRLAANTSTLLIANDRPDLALMAGCAGVHVGQEDLAVPDVRRLSPRLYVGVSTHSLEQLSLALSQAPNYVAFGPIWRTESKPGAAPQVGLESLAAAAKLSRRANIPLVAIGGITLENASQVACHADMAASISSVLSTDGSAITRAVAALSAAFSPTS